MKCIGAHAAQDVHTSTQHTHTCKINETKQAEKCIWPVDVCCRHLRPTQGSRLPSPCQYALSAVADAVAIAFAIVGEAAVAAAVTDACTVWGACAASVSVSHGLLRMPCTRPKFNIKAQRLL